MEGARFFHQQANRCYQLAWQCFDLTIAHKLNAIGNAHTAKAREFRQELFAETHPDGHNRVEPAQF